MRIAFLCFEAFHRGGIKTYTRELLNRIAAAGHRVVLLSPPPPPGMATGLSPEVALQAVDVPLLPLISFPVFASRVPLVFRKIEKEGGRFDVVHSSTYADAFLPRFVTKGLRITTVYHLGRSAARAMRLRIGERLSHPSKEYGPATALEGLCLKRAHHLVAISEFTRGDILHDYPDIDPSRISVIYLGSSVRSPSGDPDTLQHVKKTWQLTDDDRILLYVGRLEERKGIRLLLDAFARLRRGTNAKLLLIGGGDLEGYSRLARSRGIEDRVVFAGYVDEDTLNVAYSISSALLHPASMEGFGLTVGDAVATGLPVVAYRVGSIPEIVRDKIDGYLVDPGDTGAFYDRITEVLETMPEAPQRQRPQTSGRFTWDHTANQTLTLYKRLLSSRDR